MSKEISKEKKEIKGSYLNKLVMPLNIISLLMLLASMKVDGIGVAIFIVTVATYGIARAIFSKIEGNPFKTNPYMLGTLISLAIAIILGFIAYLILSKLD